MDKVNTKQVTIRFDSDGKCDRKIVNQDFYVKDLKVRVEFKNKKYAEKYKTVHVDGFEGQDRGYVHLTVLLNGSLVTIESYKEDMKVNKNYMEIRDDKCEKIEGLESVIISISSIFFIISFCLIILSYI